MVVGRGMAKGVEGGRDRGFTFPQMRYHCRKVVCLFHDHYYDNQRGVH